MSQEQKVLRDVRQRIAAMDPRFESDVADTTELMLQWIEDLRGCDSIANWCYATLATIYNLKNRR